MLKSKRISALVLAAVLCVTLLIGCAGEKNSSGELELSVCVGTRVTTLDPIYAEDIESQTVLVHLYENLMRVVSDGSGGTSVANGIAKEVEVEENTDGTVTYTFRLRSAKWSDGETVRAGDFVYAWRRLVHPDSHAPYAALLSVVCGYQEARNTGDMSLLQVTAKNDTTLEVVLDGNYDWFLKEVCTSPATMPLRQDVVQELKEAGIQAGGDSGALPWWSDPTALVTNGAYVASEHEKGNSLKLVSNPQYESAMVGPASITFQFVASPEDAETLYEGKAVDAVWPLTEARLAELAEDEEWSPVPQLGTYGVVYHCQGGVFEDILLRQAMELAIDRTALAELAGVTARTAEGLVPYGVPDHEGVDFRTCGGPLVELDPETYPERCLQAKELLGNAGYDRGSALGLLEFLYVNEGNNGAVAQALCSQWQEVLGVNVTPRGVSKQELWVALRSGEFTLAGVDLEAPGNDAECFLMDWTSDSQDNVADYENSAYDTLMAIIASAPDGTARMGCLHDAEDLLLGDYVISPLYTKGTAWELRDEYTGGIRDARGWFSFGNVMKHPL